MKGKEPRVTCVYGTEATAEELFERAFRLFVDNALPTRRGGGAR